MKILGILLTFAFVLGLQTGCASDRLAGGMRLDIHDMAAGGKLVKSIPSGQFGEVVIRDSKLEKSFDTMARSGDNLIVRRRDETGAVLLQYATPLPTHIYASDDWCALDSGGTRFLYLKEFAPQSFNLIDLTSNKKRTIAALPPDRKDSSDCLRWTSDTSAIAISGAWPTWFYKLNLKDGTIREFPIDCGPMAHPVFDAKGERLAVVLKDNSLSIYETEKWKIISQRLIPELNSIDRMIWLAGSNLVMDASLRASPKRSEVMLYDFIKKRMVNLGTPIKSGGGFLLRDASDKYIAIEDVSDADSGRVYIYTHSTKSWTALDDPCNGTVFFIRGTSKVVVMRG